MNQTYSKMRCLHEAACIAATMSCVQPKLFLKNRIRDILWNLSLSFNHPKLLETVNISYMTDILAEIKIEDAENQWAFVIAVGPVLRVGIFLYSPYSLPAGFSLPENEISHYLNRFISTIYSTGREE